MGELRTARWHHLIDEDGSSRSSVSCIRPAGRYCVVNRLGNLAIPRTPGWRARDDEYGRSEFLALMVSWLQSLEDRVIDPPGGNSLLGDGGGEWNERRLALACGLRPFPVFEVSRAKRAPWQANGAFAPFAIKPAAECVNALVVGRLVFGAPPAARRQCLGLARKLRLDTLGIALARDAGGWRFLRCERLPELPGGAALKALAELAEARSE